MTEKRFELIIDSEWWIVKDNSIKSNKYRNDLDGDDAYRGLKEGELTEKEVVDLLNELYEKKEELESFKKLVYLVLKKEYDLRMNEMNILAEKEDWQGYMATKLERGTAQRIAKRLGVDLG